MGWLRKSEGSRIREDGVRLESKHLLRCDKISSASNERGFCGGLHALRLHLYPDLAELSYLRECMHWF
jgi:hypothetical protein